MANLGSLQLRRRLREERQDGLNQLQGEWGNFGVPINQLQGNRSHAQAPIGQLLGEGRNMYKGSHRLLTIYLRSTSSLPNKVNNTHMWHKCSTNNVPKSLQSTHHAFTSNLALYAKLPPRIDCDPYATARLCVTCCHLSSSQLAIFQRQKANFHFTEQKYQYWYLLQTEHVNVNILYYQKIDCDSLSCLVVGKLGWKCKISHQKRTKGFSDFFQTLLCKKSRTSHSLVRSQIYAGHKKPLDQAGWGQGQLWEFCDIVWTFTCGLILVSFYRGKICKMWQFIDHKFKMSHGSFMQKLHFGTRHYGIQSIHVLLIEKK